MKFPRLILEELEQRIVPAIISFELSPSPNPSGEITDLHFINYEM